MSSPLVAHFPLLPPSSSTLDGLPATAGPDRPHPGLCSDLGSRAWRTTCANSPPDWPCGTQPSRSTSAHPVCAYPGSTTPGNVDTCASGSSSRSSFALSSAHSPKTHCATRRKSRPVQGRRSREEDASNEALGRTRWKKMASSNRTNHRIIRSAAATGVYSERTRCTKARPSRILILPDLPVSSIFVSSPTVHTSAC